MKDLPGVGSAGTFGTADMPVQSVSVDGFGRVTNITLQQDAPIPTPFNDDFGTMANNAVEAAEEMDRDVPITITVADGYTIDPMTVTTMNTGMVPVVIGTPTRVSDTEVMIPVTIPAVTESDDMVGTVSVETTTEVTETNSGRTRTETATPLDTMTFIPFYQMTFDEPMPSPTLGGLTASEVPLENGTMVTIEHLGAGGTDYGILALETVSGRTYRFDAGFFDIMITPLPIPSQRMFGREYVFYEFPTRSNLSFTIRW